MCAHTLASSPCDCDERSPRHREVPAWVPPANRPSGAPVITSELLGWLAQRHADVPPPVAARERLAVLRVLRECSDGLPADVDDAAWAAVLARARSAGSSPPRWLRRAVNHLRAFQARDAHAAPSVASASLARNELESELEGLPASLQGEVREALERREGSDEHELAASALAAARAGGGGSARA